MTRTLRQFAAPLLVAMIAAGAVVARGSRNEASWHDQLIALTQASGPSGWLAFVAAQTVVAGIGVVPASLLAITAGLAYGLWLGFVLAAIGTMLGGGIAFGLSRSLLRPWISRFVTGGVAARFDEAVARDGWRFVCLLRMSPVMPFAATSYGLGMTRLGLRDFLLGTLASLPALLAYVAMGALGRTGVAVADHGVSVMNGAMLAAGALATIAIALRLRQMMRRSLAPAVLV